MLKMYRSLDRYECFNPADNLIVVVDRGLGNDRDKSSSWRHAISTDIPDSLSPPLPIVHCFRQVFRVTSRTGTELLYVGSSWLSMWRGLRKYIPNELIPTFTAVSCISGSSNFDNFRDRWSVAEQLLICGVLPPWLIQYCSQHSCVYLGWWDPASWVGELVY